MSYNLAGDTSLFIITPASLHIQQATDRKQIIKVVGFEEVGDEGWTDLMTKLPHYGKKRKVR